MDCVSANNFLGIFLGDQQSDKSSSTQVEDPFAASDAIVNPEADLAGKFQKSKDGPTDVIAGLSDLTVPTLPPGLTRCSKLPFSIFAIIFSVCIHNFISSLKDDHGSSLLNLAKDCLRLFLWAHDVLCVVCFSSDGFLAVLILWLSSGGDSAESVTVAVEGFEGDYGGVAFEDESGGFGTAFEGLNGAFGGGLDASEFGATTSQSKDKDLGGLGLLAGVSATPGATGQSTPSTVVDPKVAAELSGVDPNAGNNLCPFQQNIIAVHFFVPAASVTLVLIH